MTPGAAPLAATPFAAAPDDGWAAVPEQPNAWTDESGQLSPWTQLEPQGA